MGHHATFFNIIKYKINKTTCKMLNELLFIWIRNDTCACAYIYLNNQIKILYTCKIYHVYTNKCIYIFFDGELVTNAYS